MSLYRRWIYRRERALSLRDTNRRVFPFDWGLSWVGLAEDGAPLPRVQEFSREALQDSGSFFSLPQVPRYRWSDGFLEFPTPTPGQDDFNNTAYARLFEAPDSDRAVIVLPQWNADEESHVGLCRLLQKRLGATVVRQCLPYHEMRRPPGMVRADHMVGSNVGRTLASVRQAVVELRAIAAILRERGYRRIGVTGTSIGSCVSYLAFVHDPTIDVAVFNFVSAYFADVVWRGVATRYIRTALDGQIALDDLRRCWAPISPFFYVPRLVRDPRPHLLISARYDLTFPPELSDKVFEEYRRVGLAPQVAYLPCGHYTTAHFPFSYLDGWYIWRFLARNL